MSVVKLALDMAGHGTVEVDGVDQGKLVRATTVRAEVGQLTTVELELVAGVDSNLTADVQFVAYVGGWMGRGATARQAVQSVLDKMPEDPA